MSQNVYASLWGVKPKNQSLEAFCLSLTLRRVSVKLFETLVVASINKIKTRLILGFQFWLGLRVCKIIVCLLYFMVFFHVYEIYKIVKMFTKVGLCMRYKWNYIPYLGFIMYLRVSMLFKGGYRIAQVLGALEVMEHAKR